MSPPEQEDPIAPAKSVGAGGPGTPAAGSIQGQFAFAYAAAVLAGVLPVFVSPQFWVLPLGAMVAYLTWGHARARDGGMIFEFADSFYYLGFTLSIGSLLAAIKPFNFEGRPEPDEVFRYFGLGLLTTLLGVVGRTILQTFYRRLNETVEEVNSQIVDQARQYLNHLITLNGEANMALAGALAPFRGKVEEQRSDIETAMEQMAGAMTRSAQAASRLAGQVDEIRRATEGIHKTYEAASTAAETIVDAMQTVAADIRMSSPAPDMRLLQDVVRSAREALSGLTAEFGGLRLDPTDAQRAVGDLAEVFREAGNTVDIAGRSLSGAVDQLSAVGKSVSDLSATLASGDLGEAVSQLKRAVEDATREFDDQRALSLRRSEQTQQAAEDTLQAGRALNRALQEIADAAVRRLEKMP